MSTKADQLGERVIVTGRAYVRIVEAADVLLDRRPVWTDSRRAMCWGPGAEVRIERCTGAVNNPPSVVL